MSEFREALQRLVTAVEMLDKHGGMTAFEEYSAAKHAAKSLLSRPESIEPAAAEKAREQQIQDMAMLIRQLCHALNKLVHEPPLTYRAMEYLKRHGLEGSVLRDSPPAATGEKP